jgi:hypothetical protein
VHGDSRGAGGEEGQGVGEISAHRKTACRCARHFLR